MASSSRGVDGTRIVPDSFASLENFLSLEIHILKVDQLKSLIQFLNDNYSFAIRKAGRKQELVDSISDAFRQFSRRGELERYRASKAEFNRIAYPPYRPGVMIPGYGGYTSYSGTTYPARTMGTTYGGSYPSGSNGASTSVPQLRGPMTLKWKTTPAWKVIKAVGDLQPVLAVEDDSQKRISKTSSFLLQQDVVDEIKQAPVNGRKKALRLFCTSSEYYPQTDSTSPVYMDFPNNYEITLNTQHLKLSKGLKGKANSTAPVDLMQANVMKMAPGIHNILNFTHTGPTLNKKTKTAKRFYFQVCLTEMTNSEAMKQQVLARKKTASEVVKQMQVKEDEDEIEVGSARMSLKCPLSYARIAHPMRSDLCTHIQCCDLDSWLLMNETTPSWTCPTCDRELSLEQVFVDEFFASILATCPDSVDEVLLESNGDWHTEDGKYASPSWTAANPTGPPPSARLLAGSKGPSRTATPDPRIKVDSPAVNGTSSLSNGSSASPAPAGATAAVQVFELSDSDDEEDVVRVGHRHPEISNRRSESTTQNHTPSVTPATLDVGPGKGSTANDAIAIDDSDDDDEIVVPVTTSAKQPISGDENDSFDRPPRPYASSRDSLVDQNGKRARESPERSNDLGDGKRRRTVSSNGNQYQASDSRPNRSMAADNASGLDWGPVYESSPHTSSTGSLSDRRSSDDYRHQPRQHVSSSSRGMQPDSDTIVVQRTSPQRSHDGGAAPNGYASYARSPNYDQSPQQGLSSPNYQSNSFLPPPIPKYHSRLPPPKSQTQTFSSFSKP